MSYKKHFPYFYFNKDDIYFDSAATALKPKQVLDAEYEYNVKIAANTHNNLFKNAYIANEMLIETRKKVANFIGTSNYEQIIFTSGTTHSLNQVAFGLKKVLKKDDEILLTILEHSSNLLPWKILEEQIGIKINFLDLNSDGTIDVDNIKNKINKNTKIVSFANVSNTMGSLNDVKKITSIIKSINENIIVIVDGAQSVSHIKSNVNDWNIDFFCFSAHKMFGPFGLGVLWGKKQLLESLDPIMYGGGNNSSIEYEKYILAKVPYKFEAGTLNLSAIAGLKAAIDFIEEHNIENINNYLRDLKKYFIANINKIELEKFEFYNINNHEPIILFNLKNVNAQDFGSFLNKKYNILVRTGKHCARLAKHLIDSESTIRISLSIYNNKEDIDKLIIALQDADSWIDELL
ncbi:aminotransferase class V-fold PLP-dependent enzyme [Spiroplasma tabanidicola]|uniref:cysteine desulfurase n=1 Tax=Spiroplasma tabanidicola TaxID=324079 RepID=A0A6I6C7J4_9MOLU|nr:aminotransferase class V-fold PLP-dependent enzyme [Spiroplasma tabanidicola]QGS52190.1 cysteine desulfurase [Spiroplasma tabanidicola]